MRIPTKRQFVVSKSAVNNNFVSKLHLVFYLFTSALKNVNAPIMYQVNEPGKP
jgi:hypothetical protein